MKFPITRLVSLLVAGILMAGCETDELFQKRTAEFTTCSADDVQVSDVNWNGGNTWKAICRRDARIYQCSKTGCTEIE